MSQSAIQRNHQRKYQGRRCEIVSEEARRRAGMEKRTDCTNLMHQKKKDVISRNQENNSLLCTNIQRMPYSATHADISFYIFDQTPASPTPALKLWSMENTARDGRGRIEEMDGANFKNDSMYIWLPLLIAGFSNTM